MTPDALLGTADRPARIGDVVVPAQTARDLAARTDAETEALLDRTRIYAVISMDPDGRVANTRANANGFDMNRDFLTASQPEVRAVRQALIDTQPLVMIDLHGYVNGTLIEPTTPPHGQNYEYDLFIKHAYPNGLAMEAAVNGLGYTPEKDGVQPVQIPFRDDEEGRALRDEVDAAITALREDGTLSAISEKWLGTDVTTAAAEAPEPAQTP